MQLDSGTWLAVGTSVAGTSHLARRLGCDDAHFGAALDNGTLLLAVADGAGSAAHSAAGAQRAVHGAVASLANRLVAERPVDAGGWKELLRETLLDVRNEVAALAAETEGAQLRDFASTLLLAVTGPEHVATLQVGDGAIVLRSVQGGLEVLSPAATSEYINETDFLTSESAPSRALLTVRAAEEIDAMALLTDGVEILAIEHATHTAHAPFFTPLFRFAADPEADAEQIAALLASERVNERTDDDKTLVLAVRRGSPAGA